MKRMQTTFQEREREKKRKRDNAVSSFVCHFNYETAEKHRGTKLILRAHRSGVLKGRPVTRKGIARLAAGHV